MSARFEELDWQQTPIGELSLRRRIEPALGVEVFEVKLGDSYLMSSLFPVAEIELARLGLAQSLANAGLDVVVGGLGLGYTARAVLDDPRVRSLHVIEALEAVIGWHRNGLLPLGVELTGDARTHLQHGDFFALVQTGFGADVPDRCHVLLVDIDHSPRHVLDAPNSAFYSPAGLRHVVDRLHPGGVFALWSDDPPDPDFEAALAQVFASSAAQVVEFANPLTGGTSANTVYVAIAD